MIKKILFSIALVAGLVSCNGDYDDWANPQHNDPEDAKTVEMTVGKAADVDYANISDLDNTNTQLFVPTITAETGAATEYQVTLYNDDKSKSAELLTDENGNVTAAELKAAIESLYGKAPTPRTVQMDIAGYTTVGGISIKNVATSTLGVTLVAPFISNAYYLVGDMVGWDAVVANKFTHIGDDANLYDNPEFQIIFKTTADNQYWKIIPQSCLDAGGTWAIENQPNGVVGVEADGDDALEGFLMTTTSTGAKANAGKIAEAGIYRMTINMMEYTYKIEKLAFEEFIYQAGNANNWGGDGVGYLRGAAFDGKYQGYMYLNGDFKLRSHENSWDAPDWGWGDPEGTLAVGAGNLWAEEGFYRVNADLGAMTWSVTKINVISIIGAATGDATWGTDIDLEYNKDGNYWETTTPLVAGEWKFRGNHNWNGDVDLGGSIDNLVTGGSNLNLTEAGTYNVKLYISYEGAHHAVLTKVQ